MLFIYPFNNIRIRRILIPGGCGQFLRPYADFAEAVVDPHFGQLFLRSVLRKAGAEAAEVYVI
jgi:hypothetical protein